MFPHFKDENFVHGTREMISWSVVLATLAEDTSFIPSTHILWLTITVSQWDSSRSGDFFYLLHTHSDTRIHINKEKMKQMFRRKTLLVDIAKV